MDGAKKMLNELRRRFYTIWEKVLEKFKSAANK